MDIVYKRIDDAIERAISACKSEYFMYARHVDDEWSQKQATKYIVVMAELGIVQEKARKLFE